MRMTVSSRCLRPAVWLLPFLLAMQLSTPASADCEASVSLVDFGKLDLTKGARVNGELIVTCDEAAGFSVALSPGIGSYRLRKMQGSDGSVLKYNLFVDSTRRRIWGDGVSA